MRVNWLGITATALLVAALFVTGCNRGGGSSVPPTAAPDDAQVYATFAELKRDFGNGALGDLSDSQLATLRVGEPFTSWDLWRYDPAKGGAFEQMTEVEGHLTYPILLAGQPYSSFDMNYEDGEWACGGAGGNLAADVDQASTLIRGVLGQSAEIRVVGGPYNIWVMGRAGDREAAVFFDPLFMYFAPESLDESELPLEGAVYEGEDLARLLNAIGTAGRPDGQ